MSANKRRGTAWETAIVNHLRANGFPHVERRALAGAKDRGDIAGLPAIVIEAKNQNRITLAEWLDEAETERANDDAWIGVVWFKRKGKTSAGDGYVLMSGDQFIAVLQAITETSPGGVDAGRPSAHHPASPTRGGEGSSTAGGTP